MVITWEFRCGRGGAGRGGAARAMSPPRTEPGGCRPSERDRRVRAGQAGTPRLRRRAGPSRSPGWRGDPDGPGRGSAGSARDGRTGPGRRTARAGGAGAGRVAGAEAAPGRSRPEAERPSAVVPAAARTPVAGRRRHAGAGRTRGPGPGRGAGRYGPPLDAAADRVTDRVDHLPAAVALRPPHPFFGAGTGTDRGRPSPPPPPRSDGHRRTCPPWGAHSRAGARDDHTAGRSSRPRERLRGEPRQRCLPPPDGTRRPRTGDAGVA